MSPKRMIDLLLILVTLLLIIVASQGGYKAYFQGHFKSKLALDEIEKSQIDSQLFCSTSTTEYYSIWTCNPAHNGAKYKINIEYTKSKPFSHSNRQEIFVSDIDGNIVMSYDTEYKDRFMGCWESDYIRLMKYLNTNMILNEENNLFLNKNNNL